MIDIQKLKALAEAATPGTWERGDGNEISVSHDGDEAYWSWEEAGPAQLHRGGAQASADADFIAAANPAAVLELIAEIERLRDSHQQICENYNKVSYASEERGKQIAELKAENEKLRKDAKRYRFLRNQHWPVACLAVVVNPKVSVKLGHDCPSGDRLDEQVDGAMKREASHD